MGWPMARRFVGMHQHQDYGPVIDARGIHAAFERPQVVESPLPINCADVGFEGFS